MTAEIEEVVVVPHAHAQDPCHRRAMEISIGLCSGEVCRGGVIERHFQQRLAVDLPPAVSGSLSRVTNAAGSM